MDFEFGHASLSLSLLPQESCPQLSHYWLRVYIFIYFLFVFFQSLFATCVQVSENINITTPGFSSFSLYQNHFFSLDCSFSSPRLRFPASVFLSKLFGFSIPIFRSEVSSPSLIFLCFSLCSPFRFVFLRRVSSIFVLTVHMLVWYCGKICVFWFIQDCRNVFVLCLFGLYLFFV